MLLFGPFRFDAERLVLYTGQSQQLLRPKVLQLLAYFLAHPNQVIKRETLLSALWQHGEFREAALTQSINELRQALGDNAQSPTYIRTLPQQGYQFICEVHAAKCATKRAKQIGVAVSLVAALFFAVDKIHAIWPLSSSEQIQQKPALLILPLQNETGVEANAWWGYAIESELKAQLQNHYQLKPKNQAPELLKLPAEKQPHTLALTLKPRQQRFILQASLDGRTTDVIVEQLGHNFSEIATNVLFALEVTSDHENKTAAPVKDLSDYYRGLQALNEHGPELARSYFEAALVRVPEHLPSQLELAQVAWQQGDVTQAKARFDKITLGDTQDGLQARYHLYKGTFEKAQGEFEAALTSAELGLRAAQQSQQIELIASAYQLQADIYWHTLQWQDYTLAMNAAYALIGSRSFAYSEAQRSFYLANPPAAGPQEKNHLNLVQSKKVLSQAIDYYRQISANLELATSLFAYGQNYLVPVNEGEQSLLEALDIVADSGNEYFKVQVLTYLGFYYIQLHQGEKALSYLDQVQIHESFLPATEQLQLLKAMAWMDIGLVKNDQNALHNAKRQYHQLLETDYISPLTRANTKLMLAWIGLKLGELETAHTLTEQALTEYQRFELADVAIYAEYTKMYIHLKQGQPEQALALADSDNTDAHLMLFYTSAAAQMINNESLAAHSKAKLSALRNSDGLLQQLDEFTRLVGHTDKNILDLLDAPYSVYCQSKWILE
ncbi:winged helix-turn-helix domain-containing protein [Pseudoalteromonas luteoviolacea]|uniref:OmpR/PhoB-type domain-containing protein n=1 Tax=Pseudoalteromonas luteoviolacea H33 TaxID=1365251 RepID=A0A167GBP4_9GAMM|nr:winged helix-turn-helix domain-containing protein [Pseudoalteromonas luteoviolacea]KZN54857.1 hypothetical protein N476_07560 [Pseudoalteromonas luteoviolacea H33]KZN77061.1 hypothetical protein N477_13185 [Pseudoalteromonas luteoviolacea H33-S]